MGINIEFNPDLALRHIDYYKRGQRFLEECLPELLEAGKRYHFLKEGQRNYWLEGEIPLFQTEGKGQFSRPLASIVILEATHYTMEGTLFTKGMYEVMEVFDPADTRIHFEAMSRIKR
ncbi:MAG: hypothetical protein Q8R37_05170 [Nanoarchaeota archaeon]|nr:hypothetical protein [Nanoarchaeota archaeon]